MQCYGLVEIRDLNNRTEITDLWIFRRLDKQVLRIQICIRSRKVIVSDVNKIIMRKVEVQMYDPFSLLCYYANGKIKYIIV